MRAIIIGAGRGNRLMPSTANAPKCFTEVRGNRILDRTLDAFANNGIDDICFIGGYQIDCVREAYPQFTFRHNDDWENNNILASLMYAEDLMDEPFICTYSDVLFTADVIKNLLSVADDIAVVVDTAWLDRYVHRTEHPPEDAEKVIVGNGAVTRVHRGINPDAAHGEYIGVAKFSAAGAAELRRHYQRCKGAHAGRSFREAAVFEKAYLIHLFQDMIEAGVSFAHVDTPGGYMEIDTQQDLDLAQEHWT